MPLNAAFCVGDRTSFETLVHNDKAFIDVSDELNPMEPVNPLASC